MCLGTLAASPVFATLPEAAGLVLFAQANEIHLSFQGHEEGAAVGYIQAEPQACWDTQPLLENNPGTWESLPLTAESQLHQLPFVMLTLLLTLLILNPIKSECVAPVPRSVLVIEDQVTSHRLIKRRSSPPHRHLSDTPY